MGVLFTAVSGWVLGVLIATTIGLPYLLRGAPPPVAHGSERPSVLERMRPHFWLGCAIAPLTFVHLWPAMSGGWVRQVDALGLYLASLAFLLTIVQVFLGLQLRDERSRPRRRHFWTMAGIAGLAVGHAGINGAALRVLFG
jgi:hypothetical protein